MFFGKRLKEERIRKNLSQTQLGDLVGVTKVAICGYETGKRVPSVDTLLKLANELGITPNYLLGFDVNVVSEKNESYKISISNEELTFLSTLRNDRSLYNQVLKEPKRSIKIMKKYQTN